MGLYAILFLWMFAAWFSVRGQMRWTSRQRVTVWFFAILFRLVLLGAPPVFSDDVFRYAWEGRVQRAGFNPYPLAPSAPELVALRGPSYPSINHPDIPSAYPPVAQAVFRWGTYLSDALSRICSPIRAEILGQKLLVVGFDLLALFALSAVIRLRGLPPNRMLLYAWNPLVVLEFSGSGHCDALAIACLWLAYAAWQAGREWRAGIALAFSLLAKYFALLLLPFWLFRRRWKPALILAGAALVILPLQLRGLQTYLAHWEFNGALYDLAKSVLRNGMTARLATGAVLVGIVFWVNRREPDLVRAGYHLTAAALLLSPTVYPWYVVWLIPYLCLFMPPAFLFWNASVFCSYSVLQQYQRYHVWSLHPAVLWLEYIPVFLLLLWPLWKTYESRSHHSRA